MEVLTDWEGNSGEPQLQRHSLTFYAPAKGFISEFLVIMPLLGKKPQNANFLAKTKSEPFREENGRPTLLLWLERTFS